MAIFNVTSFAAEAEVFGAVRQVSYAEVDGSLTICGLTLKQAKAILGQVSTGLEVEALEGGSVKQVYEAQPEEAEEGAPPAQQQEAEQKPDKKEKPRTRPKQRARSKKDPDPEPPEEAPAAADNVVPLGSKKGGGDLAQRLEKASKLIDVVTAMRDSGLATEAEIVAECERVKDQVPCLGRIPNIEDRVRRVLERLSA